MTALKVADAMSRKALEGCNQPAVIFNPNASASDIVTWVLAELEALEEFMHMAATSVHEAPMDPQEFAALVADCLEPIRKGAAHACEPFDLTRRKRHEAL